jgi:hypothetical protein
VGQDRGEGAANGNEPAPGEPTGAELLAVFRTLRDPADRTRFRAGLSETQRAAVVEAAREEERAAASAVPLRR